MDKRITIGTVPHRIAFLWQPYKGAVGLRPGEIAGYRLHAARFTNYRTT
jgi:hypothetical protein